MSPTEEVASDLLIEGNRIAGIVPATTSTRDDWQAIDGQRAVLFGADAARELIGEYDEIDVQPLRPHVLRHQRFACR